MKETGANSKGCLKCGSPSDIAHYKGCPELGMPIEDYTPIEKGDIEKIQIMPQYQHTIPPIDVYTLANKINEIIDKLNKIR